MPASQWPGVRSISMVRCWKNGEKGALSIGIGMGQSTGHVSLIAPTYEIGEDVPKLTIDGLEIEFQLNPRHRSPCRDERLFPEIPRPLDGGKLHRYAA